MSSNLENKIYSIKGITYFKAVYLRKGYAVIETSEIQFDSYYDFGITTNLEIPITADYINKIYIKVVLPKLFIPKIKKEINPNIEEINKLKKLNEKCCELYNELIKCENITCNEITSNINDIFENYNDINIKNIVKYSPYNINDILPKLICNNISDIDIIGKKLSNSILICNYIEQYYDRKFKDIDDNIKYSWKKNIGNRLLKQINFIIDDIKIVTHNSTWLNTWFELFGNDSLRNTYNKLIGNIPELYNYDSETKEEYILYIPLRFWFCNSIDKSLIIPKSQKLKLEITFEKLNNLIKGDYKFDVNIKSASVLIDYIHLQNKFINSRTILIEQLEYTRFILNKNTYELYNFTKPSIELIWKTKKNIVNKTCIKFKNVDRTLCITSNFYNKLLPFYNHTNSPKNGIFNYAFSLFPEENQPSGVSEFNIIKDIKLFIEGLLNENTELHVYSRNFNYLSYENDMLNLKFI